MFIHKCCCWNDLKSSCLATAMLTLVTSACQIFLMTALFTGAMGPAASNIFQTSPPVQVKLYVVLAALDVFVIIFSILLMVGLEKVTRCPSLLWLILIPFYVMFETAINIVYLIQEFGANTHNPVSTYSLFGGVLGYSIVPLIYWVLKDTLVVIGFVCVLSYYCNMTYTKQKITEIHAQQITKPATLPINGCYTNACYNGPLPQPQISRIEIHDPRPYSDRPAVPPPRIYDDYGRTAIAACREPQYATRPQYRYNY